MKWSKLTKDEIDQIWAEAKHYYDKGEELYLDPELEEEMNAIQSKHTEESPYVGIIEEFLNTPIPKNWQDMTISERRDFYKFGDESISEQSSELVQRDKVCALEIFLNLWKKIR